MIGRKELAQAPLHIPEGDKRKVVLGMTSGTSGGELLLCVKESRWSALPHMKESKRPLMLYGALTTRLSHLVGELYAEDREVERVLVLDISDVTPSLEAILNDFRPDGIMASSASFIARIVEQTSAFSERVTAVRFGESVSRALKELLSSTFTRASFIQTYAMTEVGPVAVSACKDLPKNKYHPLPEAMFAIHDPDEQGVGEIIVSKASVQEYATGDLGRLEGVCTCGERVLEVLGRAKFDYIKVAGGLVRVEELDRVAEELNQYIASYRAVAGERVIEGKVVGSISCTIVPRPSLRLIEHPERFIAQELEKRLYLSVDQTLSQLIAKGLFLPLEVSLVDAFPYEYKEKRLRRESA